MYGRRQMIRQGEGITSDLVVISSCSSNFFLSIQLKWGRGEVGGARLSSLYGAGVCSTM